MKDFFSKLKNKNFIWQPFLLTIMWTLVFVIFFSGKFETDADIFMQNLLYGTASTCGKASHLFFSNIVLGMVLSTLSKALPTIAWYTWFHYGCVFLSLWVINYVLKKKNPSPVGTILQSLVSAFVGYECYVHVSYIRTSMVLMVAFFLWTELETERESHCLFSWKTLGMLILLGLSVLISWKTAILIFSIEVLLLVFSTLIFHQFKYWIKMLVACFATMLVVTVAAYGIDQYAYRGEAWTQVNAYRDAYEKILTFGSMEYEKGFALENGIESKAQYDLLRKGVAITDTVGGFNPQVYDVMQKIADKTYEWNYDSIKMFFHTIFIKALGINAFYLVLILAMGVYYYRSKEKTAMVASAFLTFVLSTLVLYMNCALTFDRVYVVVLLSIGVWMASRLKRIKVKDQQLLTIILVVLCLFLVYRFEEDIPSVYLAKDADEYLEELQVDTMNSATTQGTELATAIDVTRYFQKFSIWKPYGEGMLGHGGIYIPNTLYSLVSDYTAETSALNLYSKSTWLFNPKDFSLEKMYGFSKIFP